MECLLAAWLACSGSMARFSSFVLPPPPPRAQSMWVTLPTVAEEMLLGAFSRAFSAVTSASHPTGGERSVRELRQQKAVEGLLKRDMFRICKNNI